MHVTLPLRIVQSAKASESMMRLVDIIGKAGQLEQSSWETDNEPLPPWLQPRQGDEEEIEEQVDQKVG